MAEEYLMNIASILFFICYIPEFYANYRNKNANIYNVFEKIILVGGTGFGLGYALTTDSRALIINYATLFTLDILALCTRGYYAYMNHGREVRILFTPLNIYNGSSSGVPLDLQGQQLPINELNGTSLKGVCPILNLHLCKNNNEKNEKTDNIIEGIYNPIQDI